jgi:aspartyl-tRNA(Asn)/glutamyl-tRNA(Gln) amidotransferase subunit A
VRERRFRRPHPIEREVVRRLKAAGAVIVGKTNMHEFAYGATYASHYGAVQPV